MHKTTLDFSWVPRSCQRQWLQITKCVFQMQLLSRTSLPTHSYHECKANISGMLHGMMLTANKQKQANNVLGGHNIFCLKRQFVQNGFLLLCFLVYCFFDGTSIFFTTKAPLVRNWSLLFVQCSWRLRKDLISWMWLMIRVFCFSLFKIQVTWLKVELCRLLEEKRSAILRFVINVG